VSADLLYLIDVLLAGFKLSHFDHSICLLYYFVVTWMFYVRYLFFITIMCLTALKMLFIS